MLGLDIGSTGVKLLELSRAGAGYRVESYGIEPLPEHAVVEKNINDVELLGAAIRRLVAACKPRSKCAAVAVAGSAVITNKIELPAGLTELELASLLHAEADQYIPYPLEEVAFDFEPQAFDQQVLIAACRKEHVDRRVAALALGGLQAKVVDVEAHCMQRAFGRLRFDPQAPGQAPEPAVAIVDIGATMTTLSVFTADAPYTREQLFGGRQLTEAIQRQYQLAPEDAALARARGSLPADYETVVLQPFREAVLQQLSRSLQFFYSASSCRELDRIILAGGTAAIEGLPAMVSAGLGCPCTIANPFIDMTLAPGVDQTSLTRDAPAMMIACGLALRSFAR